MININNRFLLSACVLAGLILPIVSHADNHQYSRVLEWKNFHFRADFKWPKHWPEPNLKKYETYPDIWGWNIPYLKPPFYDTTIYDIGVDERIVYFIVPERDKKNPSEIKYRRYFQELFRGKKWEITPKEKSALMQDNEFRSHQGTKYDRYTYEDGLPIGWEINSTPNWSVWDYPNISRHINIPHMTLKKPADAEVEKKLLVRILDRPKTLTSKDISDPDINYQGRLIFYAFRIRQSFALKDQTFLGIIQSNQSDDGKLNSKYILRYTADLKFPYLKNFNDMYTLNAREIHPILKEADAKFKGDSVELQTFLDERITTYLLNRGYKQ